VSGQFGREHLRRNLLVAGLLVCVAVWLALPWATAALWRSYDQIEPGLYLGEAVDRPPWGTEAVVNLHGQPDPYQVKYSIWDPVLTAGRQPDLPWLERVVGFIAEQRRAGRKTYVHCQAGVDRSATAMTAYLMQEHGWGRDQALKFLRTRRPVAYPDGQMMKLLAEWERRLAERRTQGRP
jgi:hypothetical protein